ncbi:hypothetical protein GGI25_000944 [Coemansia spiralis]|uniref:Metaxin n=2 Tax=Coemansia TaxID=4863 RepID=A0A9W8GDK1_9FUNG|nr:hypothetical protein BX070DRAFT_232718 [Coemansia spiralis]KAJ1993803.1 hypothetical protein EDC05_001963 [Coemansia umbellata]KAJ2623179.1 hypothetical protein GGI26_002593 [Coemansia sp. RSA 1358]KAJ2680056.1 hypothetical protein GGI25_000944 [Coemansia spiralis]
MYSLYMWGSPFELEEIYSFDPLCVSIQAYLQLCKATWQLHYVNNADVSPNRSLPFLSCENKVAESGFWRIVQFLKGEGHDLNISLDEEQLSQTVAYASMIHDGLADALLFSWYLVPENFIQVIRPRLAKLFGLPLSLIVPTQLKDYAEQRLNAQGVIYKQALEYEDGNGEQMAAKNGFLQNKILQLRILAKEGFRRQTNANQSVDTALVCHPVLRQADQYLALLSQKLGRKDYFFGQSPTLLDAVVYGYLSLVLRIDLPQNTLKTLIKTRYLNLAEHCTRVHALLKPPKIVSQQSLIAGLGAYVRQTISKYAIIPSLPLAAAQSDPKWAESMRLIVGGICVFFGYVIYNGILSVPSKKQIADDTTTPGKEEVVDALSVNEILDAVRMSSDKS